MLTAAIVIGTLLVLDVIACFCFCHMLAPKTAEERARDDAAQIEALNQWIEGRQRSMRQP